MHSWQVPLTHKLHCQLNTYQSGLILPGQAIGPLDEQELLKIIQYKNTGNGYLEAMDIHYYTDDQHVETFSEKLQNTPVKHPQDIVTKEFSRRELKRLKKGELVF